MSHLNGESLNIKDKNIEKLVALFPEVNTDGKIDFEKLKQILGEYVDDSEERYRFVWNGKGEALRLSQTPSMGTLRPAKEEGESKNWDETENLYIEGDNLEVLKLLQKSYFNKVKMIYIDPPYNTGGDFVYKDNFKDNIQNYKKITGQVDSEGNATTTNREYSGRYHTDWLNMMYPRLRLARNLLKDDGVIFISIDDHEVHNMKKICDEIFGEDNLLASFAWRRTDNQANIGNVAKVKEYILSYAKNNNQNLKLNKVELSDKAKKEYRYEDNTGQFRRDILLHKTRGRHNYLVTTPKGNKLTGPWMIPEEKMNELINQDRIYWTPSGEQHPYGKIYLHESEGQIISDWLPGIFGTNQRGATEIEEIFGKRSFDFPKPLKLLKTLIKIGTNSNDIVLDFFAGSSTTAHAVMNLNAEDNSRRKFIMVQLDEPLEKKSVAYKSGYENIAEIGKERIRRAGEKVKEELKEKYDLASEEERKEMKHPDDLDIGFKVFKLDSSNIKEWNPGKYENVQQAIEDALTPYVPGRTEEDVVYEMMLKMGLDLTYPVEEIVVNGKNIYSIGYGFLMICLSDEVDIEVAEKMIEIKDKNNQQEFRTIFRDEGFSSDTDKTNVKETLRSAGLAEESFITL